MNAPKGLEIEKQRGLTVEWHDGRRAFYSVAHLRRMSPSAEAKQLREQLQKNPLTVLPASPQRSSGPLSIEDADLVGNYAIRFRFSDGHSTGIYTWEYLREIEPPS